MNVIKHFTKAKICGTCLNKIAPFEDNTPWELIVHDYRSKRCLECQDFSVSPLPAIELGIDAEERIYEVPDKESPNYLDEMKHATEIARRQHPKRMVFYQQSNTHGRLLYSK